MQLNMNNYGQDNRSDNEFIKNMIIGQSAEKLIIDHIGKHYEVYYSGQFYNCTRGETGSYTPDGIIFIHGAYFPFEVKFTDKDISYVELKHNQWEKLYKWNGFYLQVKKGGYTALIDPKTRGDLRDGVEKKTYCNKPCYRYYPEWKHKGIIQQIKGFISGIY